MWKKIYSTACPLCTLCTASLCAWHTPDLARRQTNKFIG
jgi:hypothetical protein